MFNCYSIRMSQISKWKCQLKQLPDYVTAYNFYWQLCYICVVYDLIYHRLVVVILYDTGRHDLSSFLQPLMCQIFQLLHPSVWYIYGVFVFHFPPVCNVCHLRYIRYYKWWLYAVWRHGLFFSMSLSSYCFNTTMTNVVVM